MYKVKRGLMGLLFIAGLASGCSQSTETKSGRDKLTAKKERLIDKLGDSIIAFIEFDIEQGSGWGVDPAPSRDHAVKIARLFVSAMCGFLERDEVNDEGLRTWLDNVVDNNSPPELRSLFDLFIKATLGNSNSMSSGIVIDSCLKNGFPDAPIPLLRPIVDDMMNLAKVTKQIRELK